MALIIFRLDQEGALTWSQVDSNFNELNQKKLEASVLSNSSILIKDKDGNIAASVIGEGEFVGRLTGGNIKGLSAAEAKTLLALVLSDVDGLNEALADKLEVADLAAIESDIADNTDAIDDLEADMADAESDINTLQTALNGLVLFAKGTGTLSAGTVAIPVSGLLSTDKVLCFIQIPVGTVGALYRDNTETGGTLTIKSTSPSDNSTFYYWIYR